MRREAVLAAAFLVGLLVGSLAVWAYYGQLYAVEARRAEAWRVEAEGLNASNSVLLEKIRSLEAENAGLKARLAEALSNVSALAREKAELEGEAERLRGEIRRILTEATVVKVLPNGEYYFEVKRLIMNANRSIYVAVFAVKYDTRENAVSDPVDELLGLLVEAKRRGVDVRVLVDEYTFQRYRYTVEYLKENGVPVKLDPSSATTMHAKIVVVDGKIAVVGSHNWTEAALRWNEEYSVEVIGAAVAGKVEEYFMRLWSQGRGV